MLRKWRNRARIIGVPASLRRPHLNTPLKYGNVHIGLGMGRCLCAKNRVGEDRRSGFPCSRRDRVRALDLPRDLLATGFATGTAGWKTEAERSRGVGDACVS